MPSVTHPPVDPHYHGIFDLPIGLGPNKLALATDVFPPPQSSQGQNLDIAPGTQFVTVDTTDFEPLLFLSQIAAGPDGRTITIRIVAGALSAIINPFDLSEGVNGPAGSLYILDAVDEVVTFRADLANKTWWKV